MGVEATAGATTHGVARIAVSTRIAGASARIARTALTTLPETETVEELLQTLARLVKKPSELLSTTIACTTRIAGIVTGAASVARTTAFVGSTGVTGIARTIAGTTIVAARATQFTETFEKVTERKFTTTVARTAGVIARTTTGVVTRTTGGFIARTASIARIARFRGEKRLQPTAESKLPSATVVASDVAARTTRIAVRFAARRAGNDRIARTALASVARTTCGETLET